MYSKLVELEVGQTEAGVDWGWERGRDEQVSSHGGPLACEEVAQRKGLRKGSTGMESLSKTVERTKDIARIHFC